jgi:NhaP-type Na+/H+ or K+/H+ antiporter
MNELGGIILASLVGIAVMVLIGIGIWKFVKWTEKMMNNPNTVRREIVATRAILKFCDAHHDD